MSKNTDTAETKIERAVEAIESLTVAVCAAQQRTLSTHERGIAVVNVKDARAECKAAFKEFLAPVLRAVG